MHPMLNIAIKAARRAGTIINRAARDMTAISISAKGHGDFVTETDRAAEAAIIETLNEAYPQHAFLGEESGAQGEAEFQWIIDPIDGTTNFIHGFPQYAVSIALAHQGVVQHGLVFDPNANELYTASRGAGAFLNDKRIRVSNRVKMSDALIGTGFPYREFSRVDLYLAIQKELMQKCAGLRRPGAASLDLAYVAAGRLDGFFEFGLAPWDMAAGNLLIAEAGGLVSDFQGEPNQMSSGNVLAGTPKIFAQLLQLIAPHLAQIKHP